MKILNFDKESYYNQRRILKQKYNDNLDICVQTGFIANEIKEKIETPLIDNPNILYDDIVSLLVEGYVVRIKNDTRGDENHYQPTPLDPCNLVLNVRDDKVVWDRWEWKDIVKVYDFNEVYYLSYPSNKYISLVHHMLFGNFDIDNDAMLGDIINDVMDVFSEYDFDINKVVKMEDDTISRIFKLNKIYDKNRQG